MRKVLLLGAGRSSGALIKYLLDYAQADDFELTVADISVSAAEEKIHQHVLGRAIAFDINNAEQRIKEIGTADIVISLLPPTLHYLAAVDCVKQRKHLVTASYVSAEINALNEEAIENNVLLLNECGLDPGIDHLSAMEIINRLQKQGAELKSFKSFTGGLVAPESNDNLWGYKFTWNPRNVILAGQGTAKYIENNHYKYIPYNRLFSQIEKISVDELGIFDGYANRDSLAYRKIYGIDTIPTLLRGTLRQENFCSAWQIFVTLGFTDDSYTIEDSEHLTYAQLVEAFLPASAKEENVEQRLCSFCNIKPEGIEMEMIRSTGILYNNVIGLPTATPAQILQHLLQSKWILKPEDKDMIVMQHLFEYTLDGKNESIHSSLVTKGESVEQTAMAKTVGLPLGIVARLILQNKISLRGVQIPVQEEIYKPVLKELKEYGISFIEKHFSK